jgi:hypothetical protein
MFRGDSQTNQKEKKKKQEKTALRKLQALLSMFFVV